MRCSWARFAGLASLTLACMTWAALGVGAQTPAAAPAPVAASAGEAKELVTLLQSKKLEAFAVPDPSHAGRFVAVLHVPNVQLLVVAASYERASDIEYRIYQKDFQGAYADLRSGIMSSNRVLI